MAIYAVAVVPLIRELENNNSYCHQVWFADDTAATGIFDALLERWKKIVNIGPFYGYTHFSIGCQAGRFLYQSHLLDSLQNQLFSG